MRRSVCAHPKSNQGAARPLPPAVACPSGQPHRRLHAIAAHCGAVTQPSPAMQAALCSEAIRPCHPAGGAAALQQRARPALVQRAWNRRMVVCQAVAAQQAKVCALGGARRAARVAAAAAHLRWRCDDGGMPWAEKGWVSPSTAAAATAASRRPAPTVPRPPPPSSCLS